MKVLLLIIGIIAAVSFGHDGEEVCARLHMTAAVFCHCEQDAELSCTKEFPVQSHEILRKVCTDRGAGVEESLEKIDECLHTLPTHVRMAYDEVVSSREWSKKKHRHRKRGRKGRKGHKRRRRRKKKKFIHPFPSYYYRYEVKSGDSMDASSLKRARLVRYNEIEV